MSKISKLLLSFNILFYMVNIATWIILTEYLLFNIILLSVCLVLSTILLIKERERFIQFYTSNFFKKLTTSLTTLFLVVSILGIINYLSFKKPFQFDLTNKQVNSLTNQSRNVLVNMKGSLVFKIFSDKNLAAQMRPLLELYRLVKNDISIEVIDIEVRPDLVRDYDIKKAGTIIAEYNNKKEKITKINELTITNALIQIGRDSKYKIYYVVDHGTPDLKSSSPEGVSQLLSLINNSSYQISPLSLMREGRIPHDAKAVILLGPKTDFMKHEIKAVSNYLDNGGSLFVSLDPMLNGDKVEKIRMLVSSYGVKIQNNLIIDKKSHVNGSNGSVPIVSEFNSKHKVTEGFNGSVFFPLASSVEISREVKFGTILARSNVFPDSWAEVNLEEFISGTVSYTKGIDQEGPFNFMATYYDLDKKYKILATGNSTFLVNAYAGYSSNLNIFLNSISWLANEGHLSSFDIPQIKEMPVFINSTQISTVFYFSVLFLPLSLFVAAIYLYRRRLAL